MATVRKKLKSSQWVCKGIKTNSTREDKNVHRAGDILEAHPDTFKSATEEGKIEFEDVDKGKE